MHESHWPGLWRPSPCRHRPLARRRAAQPSCRWSSCIPPRAAAVARRPIAGCRCWRWPTPGRRISSPSTSITGTAMAGTTASARPPSARDNDSGSMPPASATDCWAAEARCSRPRSWWGARSAWPGATPGNSCRFSRRRLRGPPPRFRSGPNPGPAGRGTPPWRVSPLALHRPGHRCGSPSTWTDKRPRCAPARTRARPCTTTTWWAGCGGHGPWAMRQPGRTRCPSRCRPRSGASPRSSRIGAGTRCNRCNCRPRA